MKKSLEVTSRACFDMLRNLVRLHFTGAGKERNLDIRHQSAARIIHFIRLLFI